MTATVIRADARRLPLANASVDLICTSPPYWALRSYTDGGEHYEGQIGAEPTPTAYVDSLIECTREWMRVLKPTGSIWVNLGDKYGRPGGGADRNPRSLAGAGRGTTERMRTATDGGGRDKCLMGLPWRYALRCIDDLGLILRAEVIWSKPNGLPESVTDRVRRSHEQWFHFTRSPRYFAAVDTIREAHTSNAVGYNLRNGGPTTGSKYNGDRGDKGVSNLGGNPLGKLPGSVWEIATQPLTVPAELGVDHFAAFPMAWPRRIIQGWSPLGGTVVDPFGGTGTTALVADVLGRRGISVDRSADYCSLARWRCTDPGQRAAAMQVEKPTQQIDGQTDLLSLIGGPA